MTVGSSGTHGRSKDLETHERSTGKTPHDEMRKTIMNHDVLLSPTAEATTSDQRAGSIIHRIECAYRELDGKREIDPEFKAITHIGKMLFQMCCAMQKEEDRRRRRAK
jgi:hypothetical protein